MKINTVLLQILSDFSLGIVALLSLAFLYLVITLFLYNRRNLVYKQTLIDLRQQFQEELYKVQLETQEDTFKKISLELHDNIGQVLSFIKLFLNTLYKKDTQRLRKSVLECETLIDQVIKEVRGLSRNLNFDSIKRLGLKEMIRIESDRLQRNSALKSTLRVEGEHYRLGTQLELILFRIFQECVNNIIKHSRARNIRIKLYYDINLFSLEITDDGVGFEPERLENWGSGLTNIKKRANLVGAKAIINSKTNQGCSIGITLNPNEICFYK